MKTIHLICLTILAILNSSLLLAQDSVAKCKVISTDLVGSYEGDCKNGLANGKGEAKGTNRYIGAFKNGMPNGKGIYYYENSYHSGNFQDGIKEGKGETHYLRNETSDSVIKGFWSGDEYRGKSYETYSSDASTVFDFVDFVYSEQSGNSITIEFITSGNPDGAQNSMGNSGYVLSLTSLISTNGDNIGRVVQSLSTFKTTEQFEVHKFPAMLVATFSNGKTASINLYKAANWRIRLTLNK